jgi:hypothetical protein
MMVIESGDMREVIILLESLGLDVEATCKNCKEKRRKMGSLFGDG